MDRHQSSVIDSNCAASCYSRRVADDNAMRRLRANKRKADEAADERPQLVRDCFDAGHSWQQIAKVLGVGKARVYQLRAQGSE